MPCITPVIKWELADAANQPCLGGHFTERVRAEDSVDWMWYRSTAGNIDRSRLFHVLPKAAQNFAEKTNATRAMVPLGRQFCISLPTYFFVDLPSGTGLRRNISSDWYELSCWLQHLLPALPSYTSPMLLVICPNFWPWLLIFQKPAEVFLSYHRLSIRSLL